MQSFAGRLYICTGLYLWTGQGFCHFKLVSAETRRISLERSRPLYEVGKEGLAALSGQDGEMTEALRRIQLLHADFRGFLETAAPNSFDVIYFDPMFRYPVKRKENSIEGFRSAAVYDPLTEDVLQFAMRAARKKEIVKERPFSALFRTGLFTEIHGKRGQTTAYGVIKL